MNSSLTRKLARLCLPGWIGLAPAGRREGTVTLYASLNPKDAGPITQAFENRYKGKVVLWRAGRFTADVFECDGGEMEFLAREKLLAGFSSPSFATLPAAAFPPHRQYVAGRFNLFTIAYHTRLVKPEEVPATYQDLLQPRWAGRIGIEAGDSDWFASLVKEMGEKGGWPTSASSRRRGQWAGEIPLAAAIYNHAVQQRRQQQPEPVPVPDDRSGHRARRGGQVEPLWSDLF
jgi:iron(III) transport system substrate-binding protein